MNILKLFLFNILEKSLSIFGKFGINKKTPGVLSIYNFLFKSFWPYKNVIEIQGSKMILNVNDESYAMRKTFTAYASRDVHEKATTELFKQTVKEGNTVVDLGANLGYFTLLAAKIVGDKGKVFSFEPEPKNYSYLKKNIGINNYKNVMAFQKAVSDKNGKTKLYICDYDSGHHTINRYDGIKAYSHGRKIEEKSIDIETVTLDSFLDGRADSVNAIKIDVEGAEMLALLGMNNILKKNKDIKMIIEFFPLLIEKMGNSPREFIRKLMEDYNFSIFVIPEDYDSSMEKVTKIDTVDEIMKLRQKEEDHVNLFLKRE